MKTKLSDVDAERMQRFKHKSDRMRYIVAHGLKQHLFSQCLCEPSSPVFAVGPHGKPYCTVKGAPHFNLSHSGCWTALIYSKHHPVGIDLDFLRDQYRDGLARKICNHSQFEWYQQQRDKRQALLSLWSQKEALSKACGRGIAVGMSSIECSGVMGGEKVCFDGRDYYLHSRGIDSNGVLSCAIEGGARAPNIFLWEASDILNGMP